MEIKTFADQRKEPPAARKGGTLRKMFNAAASKAKSKDLDETPIDLYRTPDTVLVHELMHAIWGRGVTDVDMAVRWNKVYNLGQQTGRPNAKKATNNADSFANWCLVSKMMKPGGGKTPQRVYKDGSLAALREA